MLGKLKKKKGLLVLAIVGLILVLTGATYAWFSYGKQGTKQNIITSGAIKFHYSEGNHRITLNDAMPMSDTQGIATDYFEFTIESKTSNTVDIPYYITARRSGTGTNMDGIVKVYLTKVDGNNETPVELITGKTIATFSELGNYTNGDGINIPNTEHLLHADKVLAGASNYNQVYRLRMWIDSDANLLVQENGEDTYPYQDKTYTLTVNVYSSGVEVNQSTVELRANPNLTNVQIDENLLTTSNSTFEGNVEMPIGETNINKNIMLNAENPKSTARVRKIANGTTLSDQQVNDVTEPVTLNLTLGENNFDIDVTSEDNRMTKNYDLVLIADYPSYEVTMTGNNITFGSNSINLTYGSTNTVTLTPSTGYYISGGSCSNGYTISGLTIGTSATSTQTITLNNNGNRNNSVCTFTSTPITYSITYNLNGGTNPAGTVTSYTIETNTFNLPTPTNSNSGVGTLNSNNTCTYNDYTFDGWYENSDFSGNQISQIANGSTGNKTYYAKWSSTTSTRSATVYCPSGKPYYVSTNPGYCICHWDGCDDTSERWIPVAYRCD